MTQEHFFLTGALGCLGAWIVRNLVQDRAAVTVFDLSDSRHRLELIMTSEELGRVNFVRGDITHTETVINAVRQAGASHIIHLAALQVPSCKADPVKGAEVNIIGTLNIFEAAKRAGLKRVVYASSVAVYGPKTHYADKLLPHQAPLWPQTHYGVFKQANEGTARIYWQDNKLDSIGLRPYTIYGPGRDQGLTSSPTKAMLAAAAGQPYHIPYGGFNGFQLADDVAKTFILAARVPFDGAEVFNIKGEVAHMRQVVAAIEQAVPAVAGQISFDDIALPFPDGQEDTALSQLLGRVPNTPLTQGVAVTIEHFKKMLHNGQIELQ